jgi:hypothetical protein
MIHNAWMPVISMQGMNSDEIRDYQKELEKDAKLMDSLNLKIAKIYSNATGLDLERVQKMMSDETWIFSEEALELGFVSEVKEGKKIAAFASAKDLAKMGYKNTPSNYVNQLNNVNMSEKNESILDKLKALISNEGAKEVSKEVAEPKDALDIDALKAELSASIKAELSEELELVKAEKLELEAKLEAEKAEVLAKADEVELAKKEVEKAKASRDVSEAKADVTEEIKKEVIVDELGSAIINVLKSMH